MGTKTKLSTFWLLVILNVIIADILSIIVELTNKNTLDILGEVKTTMGIAALLLNIPILMIFFSKSLNNKISRSLNIIASLITILFVIGGGSLLPHYIICVSIEVIFLILIIRTAWKWDDGVKNSSSLHR